MDAEPEALDADVVAVLRQANCLPYAQRCCQNCALGRYLWLDQVWTGAAGARAPEHRRPSAPPASACPKPFPAVGRPTPHGGSVTHGGGGDGDGAPADAGRFSEGDGGQGTANVAGGNGKANAEAKVLRGPAANGDENVRPGC